MRIDALLSSRVPAVPHLRFQPGQLLQGRVLEKLADGKWLVRIRGLNLVTESTIPLEVGATFQARVLGVKEVLTLQLLPPTQSSQSARVSTAELLASLGFAATPENTALLQALLHKGWTPSMLGQLLPYQEVLPSAHPATILLAWQMGLPPHPHLLASLQTLLGEQPPMGELLKELGTVLQSFSTRHPSQPFAEQAHALQAWIPSTPQAGLQPWLSQLTTSYEAALLQEAEIQKLTNNLKAVLLRIATHLHELSDPETAHASHLVQTILQQLDGHLLANQIPLEELPLFYFQIPYTLDGQSGTITFTGEEKAQGREKERAFQFRFIAHTVHLGKLKVVLTLSGATISCDLMAEDEEARDFVQQHQDELRESLEGLQYQVERIQCTIAPPETFVREVVRTIPSLFSKWVSLDIRV